MFSLLQRLFTGTCILCDAPADRLDICSACSGDLPWLGHHCVYCAEPTAASGRICPACTRSPPAFSAALCGFEYAFPIDALIQRFKDHRQLAYGQVLAELNWQAISSDLDSCLEGDEIITAVPLHWIRQRQRGFNQSTLIATDLAAKLALPWEVLLTCRSKTAPQKSLDKSSRARSQRTLYKLKRPLAGERVVLVDDVITTGSTVNAVARCLLAGGAGDVVVVALARTPSAPPQA